MAPSISFENNDRFWRGKMKRILLLILVVVLSLAILVGCSPSTTEPVEETELLISAAASMTDVLNEIAQSYKNVSPKVKLTYTFGSSGALQTQIEEGAPADIFISAAQKQMNALEEKDLIVKETRKTILMNKVVLIAPADSSIWVKSFEELTSDEVERIGLGDPLSVPVGQYSEEIFKNLNILDKVTPKAVYGSDVRTVLTWVESGEVDLGVVYLTDAASTDKVKVVAEAPEESHKEVTYPVAVIKESKNQDEAKAFLDYLYTDEAVIIFEKHGFTMK